MRLAKFLSLCGIASRRKSEELIIAGKVQVNGEVATDLGRRIDQDKDRVSVNGNRVKPIPYGIALLYKPKFVLSSMSDPHGRKNLSHFLTKKIQSYAPVGRLDWESEGLVILTNNGDLGNCLLHPRYGHERVYEVRVDGYLTNSSLEKLEKGVMLDDGRASGKIKILSRNSEQTLFTITVTEGRNRMVRRMLSAVGHEVLELKRTKHGPFSIGHLKPAQIKILTEQEVDRITKKIMSDSDSRPKK